jgi:hypothetical protein
MADHYCKDCGHPEYDCVCGREPGICIVCGKKLSRAERAADREECFDCYL